jgi:nitrogen regulatory protein P-II 1
MGMARNLRGAGLAMFVQLDKQAPAPFDTLPLRSGTVALRMKMVMAYIRHEAFEPIRTDLLNRGFPSLTISEVKGSGRQKGITERYRGAELTNYLRPKVKLECVVADRDVQTIVDTILEHARTGSVGDGKVFVMPVEAAHRVRTGESGEEVLQAHPDPAAQS